MTHDGKLPAQADEWDEDTKSKARELIAVGLRWDSLKAEREDLRKMRNNLYVQLKTAGLTATQIAHLASSTKGAVEQVLNTERRQGS